MVEPFQVRDVLLPYGIFLVIIMVSLVSPPLGVMAGVFIPVPLILVYLQRGKIVGLLTITAVALALMLTVGPQLAIAFVMAYGIMAAAMAEGTRLSLPFEKIVLFSALAPAVLTGLVMFAGMDDQEESSLKHLENILRQEAEGYIPVLEKTGESPESIKDFREFIDHAAPALARIFPAFILVSSLVGAVINFMAVRFLWLRFYSRKYFEGVEVGRWMLPDVLVWALIGGFVSLFLSGGFLQTVGMNLVFILLFLYFLQGLAVVAHILTAKAFPKWVWIIVFFLILLNPLFMGLVMGLGLFDIWVDFRKIRVTAPPDSMDSTE